MILLVGVMQGKLLTFDHIGVPGKKWGSTEVKKWRSERRKQRSYEKEVVEVVERVRSAQSGIFDVFEYGKLKYEECGVEHPLFAIKTKPWDDEKPSVLVTGGVHGYETSGYVTRADTHLYAHTH